MNCKLTSRRALDNRGGPPDDIAPEELSSFPGAAAESRSSVPRFLGDLIGHDSRRIGFSKPLQIRFILRP